ncbi:MAG: RteC domain-containing protein [Christiangramia sp.]
MIDTTRIYSTEMFFEACLKDEMMLPDIYDFVENKTGYDYKKMLRLKHSFYQYKLKVVGKKLPEIQESEKYKLMEENGQRIPMMTSVSKFSKEEVITDRNSTTQVVWDELKEFINEFLFEYFIHLDQAEGILDHIMSEEGNAVPLTDGNSGIKWTGSEIDLTEWLKAPIEAKLIKGKSQKEIFKKFQKFLNMKEFEETEKLRSIKNRKNGITKLYSQLEDKLTTWANN